MCGVNHIQVTVKNCEFLECEEVISFFSEFSTLSRMTDTPQAFQRVAADCITE